MVGRQSGNDSVSEERVQFAEFLGREDDLGLEGIESLEIVVNRRHCVDALLNGDLRVVAVPAVDVRLARLR